MQRKSRRNRCKFAKIFWKEKNNLDLNVCAQSCKGYLRDDSSISSTSNLIKPEVEGKTKKGKHVWESINKGSERKTA